MNRTVRFLPPQFFPFYAGGWLAGLQVDCMATTPVTLKTYLRAQSS